MNEPGAAESTVIIVEDESSMRQALETLITSANYRCRSFASAEAFLAEALPPSPCCLLLDLQLDGQSGLEVQNELNARQASPSVLFVSGDDNIARAVSAMKAGAMDFVQKPFDPEVLLTRVERALQASAHGYDHRKSATHDAASLAGLTQREHEILALLADGNTDEQAARILDISVRTAASHRVHIMEKLEAHTLADLFHVWIDGTSATEATRPAPGA